MPTRKKLVKETMLPAKQAPVSFYGASAPRATLIMDKDGTKFERNQHVQLANAPLIDWASKANIKQGGGRFDNGPHPPAKPLNAFAQLVKQHKTRLLQDANLRAAYRDALPAAVVLQEAKAQARKEWKNMDADARAALDAQAEGGWVDGGIWVYVGGWSCSKQVPAHSKQAPFILIPLCAPLSQKTRPSISKSMQHLSSNTPMLLLLL